MTRQLIRVGAAIVLSVALTAPVQAETLKFLVSWGPNNVVAHMPAAEFAKNLKAANTDLTTEISGPETVPPFEQMTPVSTGVFDLLYTHPAYHSKGLAVVTNAMKPDTDKIRSSGVFAAIDDYYQKNHNMKLLALVPVGTHGYHCYLREPLSADGDWKGRKIRGVSTYVGVIKELGGAPVSTTMGEVYSSLEKGVIDGACAPINVFRATKHYEVAKYRTEPTFGQLVSMIGMNLDKWKSLTDAQRATLDAVGKATEADTKRIGDESLEVDNKAMAAAGVTVTKFPDSVTKRVHSVYYSSVWDVARKCCGDAVPELEALVKKAGLGIAN